SKRDWSSDVCSSDLLNASVVRIHPRPPVRPGPCDGPGLIFCIFGAGRGRRFLDKKDKETPVSLAVWNKKLDTRQKMLYFCTKTRSEERRVGKECRDL